VTAYYTNFLNETENVFGNAQTVSRVMESIDLGGLNLNDDDSFLQVPIFFGAAVMQGVDRRHAGVEVGIEAKPVPAWVFSAAASLGRFVYTSRPNLLLSLDNSVAPIIEVGEVYQKNFYVPRTPQTAASLSVKHENRRFWFASLTLNFADNLYYDFDRVRRTALYAEGQNRETPVFRQIVDQQKAPAAYTLDFFGGKSWRFYGKYFLYLNAGINNLLNNKTIITGGRESYRNAFRNDVSDPRFYTTELFYAPGLNYFISVAVRY
jgi:hypothetical protein